MSNDSASAVREQVPARCFEAYDIRGRVPDELDAIGWRIGRGKRPESPMLADALTRGSGEGGANVNDIGPCGTDEVYFATSHQGADGGGMITASHSPQGYGGMKLVRLNVETRRAAGALSQHLTRLEALIQGNR